MVTDVGEIQCKRTKECSNKKCFWMLRDNYGWPPWYYDGRDKDQQVILDKVGIVLADVRFPKLVVEVGTNCINIWCHEFSGVVDESS